MHSRRSCAALASGVAALLLAAAPAGAHNAAHFYSPDGTCHEVGSNKEAPIVGAGNPHQTDGGQLDLIADPNASGVDTTDQYGARYAANQGNTPLLPGNCP
jgi:hypothetical protein